MNWVRIACLALVLTACSASQPEEEHRAAQPLPDRVVYNVPTGDDQFRDEAHGQEAWFAVGAMQGVGELANGVVQAHVFDDGAYRLELQLNIERAPDGSFYEAWLAEEGSTPVSLGHLYSRFGDARHTLQYDAQEDLRSMTRVQVTLEPDDGDPAQGQELVAEGTLVARER